jgi:hypothetical protein
LATFSPEIFQMTPVSLVVTEYRIEQPRLAVRGADCILLFTEVPCRRCLSVSARRGRIYRSPSEGEANGAW